MVNRGLGRRITSEKQRAVRFAENVIFAIGVTNFRSQKAVEKIGAVRVGSRADSAGRESFVYAIARSAAGKIYPRMNTDKHG